MPDGAVGGMMRRKKRKFALVLLFFFGVLLYSPAQTPAPNPRFDNLVFKVAVFGPSDEIFIWWGHAALIVENTLWGYARVFDWGIFSYPSDNFLWDFIHDRVRYKSSEGSLQSDIEAYIAEDRDITVYTLNLDAAGKEAMLKYAENDVLPENCYYKYHQFRDNCSTSIRDLIDMGTGGQFREIFENSPGRFSLRQHTRRFTWSKPFADWFLGFLMGQNLDEPVSAWEEMFLPVEIGRNIVDFRYTNHAGVEQRLVNRVEILNTSKARPPVLNAPLNTWSQSLVIGLFIGAFFFLIRMVRRKFPLPGRILWGLMQSILGISLGAAGTVLFYGSFLIPDDYIRQNINLLFVNPLFFALVPLGIWAAAGGIRPHRWLRMFWTCEFAALLFSLLIKILPVFYQQNQPVQFLMLPIAAVLCDFKINGKSAIPAPPRVF